MEGLCLVAFTSSDVDYFCLVAFSCTDVERLCLVAREIFNVSGDDGYL